jgi:hypothetical protein
MHGLEVNEESLMRWLRTGEKMINLHFTVTINRPVNEVWNVVYTKFTKVGDWATGVFSSRLGKTEENADRVCDTFTGVLYEKIISKDEKNHVMHVEAKGLPFFVKSMIGGYKLREISPSNTHVTFFVKIKTMPFIGTIMEIPMRMQLNKALSVTLNDLKTYVETGKISSKKQGEIERKR